METSTEEWARLGEAQFVSLGKFRKSGDLVRTPVWIAPVGDTLVVTTEISTGKVRRLKRNPQVVLRICDRMGNLNEDAPDVEGVGALAHDDAQTTNATNCLRDKYGFQFKAFLAVERFVRRLQRRPPGRVIVSITPAA